MYEEMRKVLGAALLGSVLSGCSDEQVTHPSPGSTRHPQEVPSGELVASDGVDVTTSNAREVWVSSQGTSRLFIVQDQGRSVETMRLPDGAGPHITTFTADGETAFISGMGDGNLYIVDADGREIRQTIDLGPAGTHQARIDPHNAVLLVAQVPTRTLFKLVLGDGGHWSNADELTFPPEVGAPICTIFRPDGMRAYVSLLPSGLAVVDVSTMTTIEVVPTDGFLACGMVPIEHGREAILASSGSGGHIYRLSTVTGELESLGTMGAPDWHSFILHNGGRQGFGTVPRGDGLALVDIHEDAAESGGFLRLDPTPGPANDQPDRMGFHGNTLYVTLRASGKLAIVDLPTNQVRYLDLSPPAPFNPATCAGCALHGVVVRPHQ